MKLSLTQENLNKALGIVSRIVSSRSSLPVLGNVLLTTESGRLKVSATNLEIGVNCWIGSKVEQDGAVTVPARLFSEFISSLPSGTVDLLADEAILTVKTPHYESKINGIPAEEFPLIPQVKDQPTITIPSKKFKEALAQVVVAASIDESRPVLAGVYLYLKDKKLVLVATDSYRLAEYKMSLNGKEDHKEFSVIVPAKTMQELVRVLPEEDEDLSVYIADNQIMFEVDNIEMTSRLIEGQFPNYEQIIPQKAETAIEISSAEFGRIAKVASLFARENAGGIKVEIKKGGQVSVLSAATQLGDNVSSADCITKGGDGEVSLNARYLSEALSVIKSPEVEFSISGKLNPCAIKPLGKNSAEYIHIIMPLRA